MMGSGTSPRRFTLSDAMVLIAATALGLAWTAPAWPELNRATRGLAWSWAWFRDIGILVLASALPCLLTWTAALTLLRIRRPRPSWRRASRQPGMTASLAVMLATLTFFPFVLALIVAQYRRANVGISIWRDIMTGMIEVLAVTTPVVGFVVLIAWTMLAIQRQWRCEASWIDRAGRILGALWITCGTIFGAVFLVQYLR